MSPFLEKWEPILKVNLVTDEGKMECANACGFEAECKHQQDIEVILMGETGEMYVFKSIKDLLPLHFDADFL